ncbi:MAG: sulfatase family protein [Isosphaeraceae bacterium]
MTLCRRAFLPLSLLVSVLFCSAPRGLAARPNIVIVLADDMGWGDAHCLNAKGQIATPRIDRLATQGMLFTDAHSGSAVCTPTRYGVLTGRYAWRSRLASGVLNGYSPRLIEPGRLTLPQLLKNQGYRTACIGKWHLGLNWQLKEGGIAQGDQDAWKVDYARPYKSGPNSVGFDEFLGISASLDIPPYVFLENDHATEIPTVEKKWIRTGPAARDFEAQGVLPRLTERAVAFIERQAPRFRGGTPFFLYLAFSAPHTPIVPTKAWQGRSRINPYADFVMQTDAAVGQVIDALEKNGLASDTLLFVTSDNGCSPMADLATLKAHSHDPSAGFRGYKADIYEGGHRIPLLVRWPGHVLPGTMSDQLVGLTDLMATCAGAVGTTLPDDAAEDSVSFLPVLRGQQGSRLRESLVNHSINGSFAIRQGRWKLALCPGSGGWSFPRPGIDDVSGLPDVQLFDLAADRAETTNVQADHPEVVARLSAVLDDLVARGRSTPGPERKNARQIDVREGIRLARKRSGK